MKIKTLMQTTMLSALSLLSFKSFAQVKDSLAQNKSIATTIPTDTTQKSSTDTLEYPRVEYAGTLDIHQDVTFVDNSNDNINRKWLALVPNNVTLSFNNKLSTTLGTVILQPGNEQGASHNILSPRAALDYGLSDRVSTSVGFDIPATEQGWLNFPAHTSLYNINHLQRHLFVVPTISTGYTGQNGGGFSMKLHSNFASLPSYTIPSDSNDAQFNRGSFSLANTQTGVTITGMPLNIDDGSFSAQCWLSARYELTPNLQRRDISGGAQIKREGNQYVAQMGMEISEHRLAKYDDVSFTFHASAGRKNGLQIGYIHNKWQSSEHQKTERFSDRENIAYAKYQIDANKSLTFSLSNLSAQYHTGKSPGPMQINTNTTNTASIGFTWNFEAAKTL